MVIYKGPVSAPAVTGVPSITSAYITAPSSNASDPLAALCAWQPSTWPAAPSKWTPDMIPVLRKIFKESMLNEIDNVIADSGGNLDHRGHVVGIALFCALDAISSYGYGAENGKQIPGFVKQHFPQSYKPYDSALLRLYRHAMVHSWNLFEARMLPRNEGIKMENGILSFGLLDFREALSKAVHDYFAKLTTNPALQQKTLRRYRNLKSSAKS